MQFVTTVIYLFLVLVPSSWAFAAQSFCEVREFQSSPTESRMAAIEFPDGRQLSIIGQVHGSREIQDFIVSGKDLNEIVIRAEVALENPSVRRAIRYLREDVAMLRTALGGKVEFIGLEIDQEFLPVYKSASALLYEAFQGNELAKVSQVQALSPLTLLFVGGPANYLNVLEPHSMQKIEMVGIEDEKLGDQDTQALEQVASAFKTLIEAANGDQKLLDFLDGKDHQLAFEVYPNYDPLNPEDEMAVLKQIDEFPNEHKEKAEIFLKAFVRYFKTLSARDDFSTNRVLSLKKSGLILTGLMHQKPMMNRLVAACRSLL